MSSLFGLPGVGFEVGCDSGVRRAEERGARSSLRPRPGNQNARPVAMLCYQNPGVWGEGLGPPEGFTHEVYAHLIDARFLQVAARLLSFEDRDDNRVRRVTERHVR